MKKILMAMIGMCVGGWSPAAPAPGFQALSRSAVVVKIDGREVTKGEIERQARTVMVLNMNKQRRTKVEKSDISLFRRQCASGSDIVVNRACIAKYAEEHGLTNSVENVTRVTRRIERQFGVRSKKLKRWHNLDDLKYMLGKNAPILDQEVVARASFQTVTNFILTSKPVVVTGESVTNRIKAICRYNERMTATNALIFAQATNVWKRIISKELTFEQAATNYSEDAYLDMGCEWGTFSRDQIADDPSVLAILPNLKVGDITPPLESDGGLGILRLDEIEQDKNFTFSRVFFKLPMFFDVESPEQARAVLLEKAQENLIRNELSATRAKMRIEYPSGTNLFAKGSAPLKVTKEDLAD